MDDRTFDPSSARRWIDTIEASRISPREHDIYPRLNAWLRRTQPLALLEIGAGQGICSDKIDLDGASYTGVEPSPYLLERASQLYARADRRFVPGNAYALPFDAGIFDAAFSVAVWHLLADLDTAARELGRVLRPGGAFLIITANPGGYTPWIEHYAETRVNGKRLEGRASDGSCDVLYLHTFDDLARSLRAAYLVVEAIESFRAAGDMDMYVAIAGRNA